MIAFRARMSWLQDNLDWYEKEVAAYPARIARAEARAEKAVCPIIKQCWQEFAGLCGDNQRACELEAENVRKQIQNLINEQRDQDALDAEKEYQ